MLGLYILVIVGLSFVFWLCIYYLAENIAKIIVDNQRKNNIYKSFYNRFNGYYSDLTFKEYKKCRK